MLWRGSGCCLQVQRLLGVGWAVLWTGLRVVRLWFTMVSILSVPGFWVISFRVGLVAG